MSKYLYIFLLCSSQLAQAQSGSSWTMATDGKTRIINAPPIDGCAAPGGLRFDGASGTIYCPGFFPPPPMPVLSNSTSTFPEGGSGRAPNTSETTNYDDGSSMTVTTDDSGNVVSVTSTSAPTGATGGAGVGAGAGSTGNSDGFGDGNSTGPQ